MNTSQPNETQPTVHGQLQALTPVANSERIELLDVLRGFALIGIILMNIEWFNRSFVDIGRFDYQLTGVDWAAGWLVRLFVEGKFWKLFSLLFGMGFAVMLLQAKRKEQPFFAWFCRRMSILFVIGMAHMVLLWGGDILHDYAVGGLILVFWIWLFKFKWMHWANKDSAFLKVGLSLLALPFVVSLGIAIVFGTTKAHDQLVNNNHIEQMVEQRVAEFEQDGQLAAPLIETAIAEREGTQKRPDVDTDTLDETQLIAHKAERRFISRHKRQLDREQDYQVLKHGSYAEIISHNTDFAIEELKNTPIMALVASFPLFLIGYWFVASGVIVKPARHKGLFKAMAWIGVGFGIVLGAAMLIISANPMVKLVKEFEITANLLMMLSQYFMTAGYIGVFVLIMLSDKAKRWVKWLAPMGKMALTNYLMQTVILSFIFFNFGLGLYGEVSRFAQMGIVLGVITAQAILSNVWLKHYRFGPMEWLWRSLTYKQKQPFRLKTHGSITITNATVV